MILEEFDQSMDAVINPWNTVEKHPGFPKVGVSCFSRVTFERMLQELGGGSVIGESRMANMAFPIYRVEYQGMELALFMADVGAPGCVTLLEEVFEMGMEKLVLFGTCGVLDARIGDCSVIIPNRAVRDEGTSFHYAPPSEEIGVNPRYIEEFVKILKSHNCHYTVGKVWTTDGVYRETREKVKRRKESGCICVDMECSAVAALAGLREKEVFQFFYAADNLDSEVWEQRSLSNDSRLPEKDRVAKLALELAVKMGQA